MAATEPITPEPRRLSIRLPRPLWIGVATAVLVVTAVALQFGMPIYRRYVATREIERVGGLVTTFGSSPAWLELI